MSLFNRLVGKGFIASHLYRTYCKCMFYLRIIALHEFFQSSYRFLLRKPRKLVKVFECFLLTYHINFVHGFYRNLSVRQKDVFIVMSDFYNIDIIVCAPVQILDSSVEIRSSFGCDEGNDAQVLIEPALLPACCFLTSDDPFIEVFEESRLKLQIPRCQNRLS